MRYILGFDGGGTKTECVLMDSSDHVLARTYAGPSNPSRIGVELAARSIEEAATLALRDAGLERSAVAALAAGIAGTSNPEMKSQLLAALQAAFPSAAVTVLTDLDAALAAAAPGPAIVLVAGTGSAAIGRNAANQICRVGGHGPWASDLGSAYDVGRRAVAIVASERETNGNDSLLGKQILAHLNCAGWPAVQERAQSVPDQVFPSVFPVVTTAADAGDAAAREILLQAVGELSSLVLNVAERLGLSQQAFALVKTGGTVGRSIFFDTQLDAALKRLFPGLEFSALRVSPAEAAALAASR
jgi:N-acetylglucosamine kinase-like BadF-type ATPase